MDFEKFTPINNRVVIKLQTHEEYTTEGGIIITEKNEDPLTRKARVGTVLSCGPKCSDVKPNDKVSLSRYAGQAIKIEGQEYILVIEDEILGIF